MVSPSNYSVNADEARAKCASVLGTTIADETPQPGQPGSDVPYMPGMEPWSATKVTWLMPFLHVAYKFPYQKAAEHFKDDCFHVDDDEMAVVSPAMEEAAKWAVWKLNLSAPVSHPLVALAVAIGGVAAAKWGIYEFHKSLEKSGHPRNWQQTPQDANGSRPQDSSGGGRPGTIQSDVVMMRPPNPQPRPAQTPPRPAPAASQTRIQQGLRTGTGKMVESGEGFSSAENPTPESPTSSASGFVIADE